MRLQFSSKWGDELALSPPLNLSLRSGVFPSGEDKTGNGFVGSALAYPNKLCKIKRNTKPMKNKSKRNSHGLIKLVKRLTTAQSKRRANKINRRKTRKEN
jgi:hypothetical protein